MQFNLLEEGRAIDGMSLSFNIPCSCCTVHGMVWWDQELLLFPDREVFALMPGIHTLFLFEGIRMEGSRPGRGIALEWSRGRSEGQRI